MLRRVLGPFLVVCLFGIACGDQAPITAPEPTESPSPTVAESPSPSPTGPEDLPADWTLCRNEAKGFALGYPQDWHTAALGEQTQCRWFDPETFELERGTEPPVVALMTNMTQQEFSSAVDRIGGERARVIARERTTVNGHDAVRFEVEQTEGVLYPDGTKTYGYVIDANGNAFYVQTLDVPDVQQDYPQNKDVVDQAAETVRFGGDTADG